MAKLSPKPQSNNKNNSNKGNKTKVQKRDADSCTIVSDVYPKRFKAINVSEKRNATHFSKNRVCYRKIEIKGKSCKDISIAGFRRDKENEEDETVLEGKKRR